MAPYRDGNDVIEFINRDCRGARIMQSAATANDLKSLVTIFKSICEKYGHSIQIVIQEKAEKKEVEDWIAVDERFKF